MSYVVYVRLRGRLAVAPCSQENSTRCSCLVQLSLVVITAVSPRLALLFIAIVIAYVQLSRSYVAVTRDLRRLEAQARSPLFSGFTELLAGISTVRAFAAEQRFFDDLFVRLDHLKRFDWSYWMCNRHLYVHGLADVPRRRWRCTALNRADSSFSISSVPPSSSR